MCAETLKQQVYEVGKGKREDESKRDGSRHRSVPFTKENFAKVMEQYSLQDGK